MEQQEKQDKIMRKLKKQLKFYIQKVEEIEGKCYFIFSMTLQLAQHQSSYCCVQRAPSKKITTPR